MSNRKLEIRQNCTISENARFGSGVVLLNNTIIGESVKIGKYCSTALDSFIGEYSEIPDHTRFVLFSQSYKSGVNPKLTILITTDGIIYLSMKNHFEKLTFSKVLKYFSKRENAQHRYFDWVYQNYKDFNITYKKTTKI